MSHFVLAVISSEDEDIDSLLEQFSENWDWYRIGGRWNNFIKTKDGRYVNQARIKDIDFTPSKKAYDSSIRFWEVMVEGKTKEENEHFISFYKKEYYLEKYQNKENYAYANSLFSTFAVLKESEWYEQGEMLMFGISKNDDESWELMYKERFIDTSDEESMLTIVDCHI